MPIINNTPGRRISAIEATQIRIRNHEAMFGRKSATHNEDPQQVAAANQSATEARETSKSLNGKAADAPPCNPFHPHTINITDQMTLINRDRRLARALAALHGVSIPEHADY